MIRLTKKVFTDLSIWMIGLGILIGIIFPFLVSWIGIPSEFVFKPWFFIACITAGIILGAINIRLARVVVGSRMKLMRDHMIFVTENLHQIKAGKDCNTCTLEQSLITVDSEDEIGESAQAFNSLVETFFEFLETEKALSEFTQLLGSQFTVQDLSEKVLQQLMEHTNSDGGAIVIEEDSTLKVVVSHGIQDINGLLDSDPVKNALRTESRVLLSLSLNDQLEGILTDFHPPNIIIEPVLYNKVILGLIVLVSANNYGTDALTRLNLISQSLALALHNALLHDRLEQLAAMDSLTGIFNRRFGLTRLHEEFSRTLRNNVPIGVMMMDLDHFKKVNDTYGHLTGDRILLLLARVARSVLREGDILVRYGGDEFLAILPGASNNDVSSIADRLCKALENNSVMDGDDMINITVSIGGVSHPEHAVAVESELVDLADQALYRAKESGRNCITMAP